MNGFAGMDPEAVRAVGLELKAWGDRLGTVRTETDVVVRRALHSWEGPDLEAFHHSWVGSHSSALAAAAAAIGGLGQALLNNVAEQVAASGGGSAAGAGAAWAGLGGLAAAVAKPVPGKAAKNAAWWSSLTPEQRRSVLANHPDWVNNLDGIPGSVRSQANMALLPQYRDQLEDQARALRSQPGDHSAQLAIIENKLKGLDAVEKVMAQGGRQLLVLDITGKEQLMAAVAVGNVDTADHIAVMTPGLGTSVEGGLANYDQMSGQLKGVMEQELHRHGDGGTVATVSWLGYEAPQISNSFDADLSVAGDGLAKAGGDKLASFYNGLDSMRSDNAHITALGHSYGSTTTGYALQHATGVDDVVFYGSPGIGTDARSIRVPDGHKFYIESTSDAVGDLGRFAGDPSYDPGLRHLSADLGVEGGHLYRPSYGHSEYLAPGSTSQHNIVSIAVGHPESTVSNYVPDFGIGSSAAPNVVQAGVYAGVDAAGNAVDAAGNAVGAVGNKTTEVKEGLESLPGRYADSIRRRFSL